MVHFVTRKLEIVIYIERHSDEVDAKGLINDPGGANEEMPSSEFLPDMGSSEKHDSSG